VRSADAGRGRRRKRQIVMSNRSRFGQWLKLIAPGAVDRIAKRAIAKGK
jgi:hypothetical protein